VIAALARASVVRLRRSPREHLRPISWLAFAYLLCIAKISRGSPHGATDLLAGMFASFILPFTVFAIVNAVLGRGGMRAATRGFVAIGADPVRAAVATTLVAMAVAGALTAIIGFAIAALAHGPADPPLLVDALVTAGVAGLGGAVYASFFCAGASLGQGNARGFVLAFDILFATGTPIGILFPRAHVMALMGAEPTLAISRRASSIVLVALALVYLLLVVRFTRRRAT
jgi:hypothetical protein